MPLKLNGSTSGYTQLQAAAAAANNTITLPSGTGTLVQQTTTASPTNGQIPIGNGSSYVPSTLTAGTNISISNGAGSVTINAIVAIPVGTTLTLANTLGGF